MVFLADLGLRFVPGSVIRLTSTLSPQRGRGMDRDDPECDAYCEENYNYRDQQAAHG
jgi:hypothetical protein